MSKISSVLVKLHDVIFRADIRLWLADPANGSWHFEDIINDQTLHVFYPDLDKSQYWRSMSTLLNERVEEAGGWKMIQPLVDLGSLLKSLQFGQVPYDEIIICMNRRYMTVSPKVFQWSPNDGTWKWVFLKGMNYPVFHVDLEAESWQDTHKAICIAMGNYYTNEQSNDNTIVDLDDLLLAIKYERLARLNRIGPIPSDYVLENHSGEWEVSGEELIVYHKLNLGRSPFGEGEPLWKYYMEVMPKEYTKNDLTMRCAEQEALYTYLLNQIAECKWTEDANAAIEAVHSSMRRKIEHNEGVSGQKRDDMIWDLEWAYHDVLSWIIRNMQNKPQKKQLDPDDHRVKAGKWVEERFTGVWLVQRSEATVHHCETRGRSPFRKDGPLYEYYTKVKQGIYFEEDLERRCDRQSVLFAQFKDKVRGVLDKESAISIVSQHTAEMLKGARANTEFTDDERADMIWDINWAHLEVVTWLSKNL